MEGGGVRWLGKQRMMKGKRPKTRDRLNVSIRIRKGK